MPASRPYPRDAVTGVILAGGKARRMGGDDKGLIEINGRAMIEYVVDALEPQVTRLLINANRNHERYAELAGCEVIADATGDFAGPLAGMASAMRRCDTEFLLTAPCDSPLVSAELGPRLFEALDAHDADIAVAHDGDRLQPVFALIRSSLLDSLERFLAAGERKIDAWYSAHRNVDCNFAEARETFLNVNTPQERQALAARLATEH